MILVDTSVIVAWLDHSHPHHRTCAAAVEFWAQRDRLAVSTVSLGELAVGGRTREAVNEDLRDFTVLPLDSNAAWRAGMAFRQYRRNDSENPVLPDFFIRAQAAALHLPHLTNDRRRIRSFPDVDFKFV